MRRNAAFAQEFCYPFAAGLLRGSRMRLPPIIAHPADAFTSNLRKLSASMQANSRVAVPRANGEVRCRGCPASSKKCASCILPPSLSACVSRAEGCAPGVGFFRLGDQSSANDLGALDSATRRRLLLLFRIFMFGVFICRSSNREKPVARREKPSADHAAKVLAARGPRQAGPCEGRICPDLYGTGVGVGDDEEQVAGKRESGSFPTATPPRKDFGRRWKPFQTRLLLKKQPGQGKCANTKKGHQQRTANMQDNRASGPEQSALLKQADDFRRKRGKCGQRA